VRLETKRLELFGRWFGAGRIVATVEVSGNRQAGLSSGGADEVQDLLMAVEWFASPVFGDLGEETVLNGIPLGSASRVMGNGESQPERIGQLRLEFSFPSAATIAVAAAGVAQYEELARVWIAGSIPLGTTNVRWRGPQRRVCHARRPPRPTLDWLPDHRCRKGWRRRWSRSGSRDR